MTWLADIAQSNYVLAVTLFILLRAMAIIVPPIPGALLDIPAVQIFGWKWAFVFSEVGIMLGASIAFGLGRRFRNGKIGGWIGKRLRIDKVREWEKLLPVRDQFLAWLALRLPTNAAFDYISFAAGLTNCSVWVFFWSTLIGNIPLVFIFFFLTGIGFQYNTLVGWILPLAFIALISIPVMLRLRWKIKNLPHK